MRGWGWVSEGGKSDGVDEDCDALEGLGAKGAGGGKQLEGMD